VSSSDQQDRSRRFVSLCMPDESGSQLRIARRRLRKRIQDAFDLLPLDAQEELLALGSRLRIDVSPDSASFMPMRTHGTAVGGSTAYVVTVAEYHGELDQREFAAQFVRELARVASGTPPEASWPTDRRAAAEFRERLEAHADLLVWKWGLKELNLLFIRTAYPAHRAETLIQLLEKMAAGEL
jgi:hypothetical protein